MTGAVSFRRLLGGDRRKRSPPKPLIHPRAETEVRRGYYNAGQSQPGADYHSNRNETSTHEPSRPGTPDHRNRHRKTPGNRIRRQRRRIDPSPYECVKERVEGMPASSSDDRNYRETPKHKRGSGRDADDNPEGAENRREPQPTCRRNNARIRIASKTLQLQTGMYGLSVCHSLGRRLTDRA